VVSALDEENRADFNVTLSWLHDAKSAFIKREEVTPTGPELIKDSKFNQTVDWLNLRGDIGILWDIGLHIDALFVLRDESSLEFDQSASPCVYPGGGGTPTCVNQQNSTILRDGILPAPTATSYGLDAQHGGRAFNAPDKTLFQGPLRRGFQTIGGGINWAIFNQLRDDTKPTWTLGFDVKLDLFGAMKFDPANPSGNTAVGPGYHQLIWNTAVSKRFKHLDPYFSAWYMLPIRTGNGLYQTYPGDNQGAVSPQQAAGVFFGVEDIAWENARGDQRITIEFRGRATEHFFGRSASELWQVLAGRSDCNTAGTPQCRAGLDEDLNGDGKPDPFPGVTETQAYGTFGGDAGLNVQVGRYARFRGLFGLTFDMPHFITFANAGVDRNGDMRVDSNDRTEANPTYRELIDLPGRRFKVEGTRIWSLFLEGSIMF